VSAAATHWQPRPLSAEHGSDALLDDIAAWNAALIAEGCPAPGEHPGTPTVPKVAKRRPSKAVSRLASSQKPTAYLKSIPAPDAADDDLDDLLDA